MLTNHNAHHQLAKALSISACTGAVLWISLLMATARQLAMQTHDATANVTVGPLVLDILTRHKQNHGYAATISFEKGLAWYGVGWLIIGVLWGTISWRVRQNHHTADDEDGDS